jgi:hypothetical protein
MRAAHSLNKNKKKMNLFAENHKANFVNYNPLLKKSQNI